MIVENVNDPPVARDDFFDLAEDSEEIVLSVAENDTFLPDPPESLTLLGASDPENGGVVRIVDGRLRYRPAPDFFGSDEFTYAISDESGVVSSATVHLLVNSVNDLPRLQDDSITIELGSERVEIEVLLNDTTAPENDEVLSLLAVTQGIAGATIEIRDRSIVYLPSPDFVGRDQFTYSATDGNGGVSAAVVVVIIEAVSVPPIGEPDFFDVDEDSQAVSLPVLANDVSGALGDSSLRIHSVTPGSEGGQIVIDGEFLSYTPLADFSGMESFSYKVAEGTFESEDVLVSVDVRPVNDPIVARDDSFSFTNPVGPLRLDVLANDSIAPDVDETLVILSQDSDGSGGVVELEPDSLLYHVGEDFEGVFQFRYSVSDGNGGIATASVEVSVLREDSTVPVVFCRNIDVVLDADGRVEIVPEMLDAGSFDDSGELFLSLSMSAFSAADLGGNEVVLFGEDSSGNRSECHAVVTVTAQPELGVEIVLPEERSVYAVDESYGFTASDVPVEVVLAGEIESMEILGDGVPIFQSGGAVIEKRIHWDWLEVPLGDHQLQARATGIDGTSVVSSLVRFSVSELDARVALVVPDSLGEQSTEAIQEWLFEMGVNSRVFQESMLSEVSIELFDLTIWARQMAKGVSKPSLEEFERLVDSGMPIYIFGSSLLDQEGLMDQGLYDRWTDLLMFEPLTGLPLSSGTIELTLDTVAGLVVGRFGTVRPFTIDSTTPAVISRANAQGVATLAGEDIIARLDVNGFARRFVQLFSIPEDPIAQDEVKTLFQNAVCWLLKECRDCRNASLLPSVAGGPIQVSQGERFFVELSVANNGECDVIGAEFALAGNGIVVDSLEIDGRRIEVTYDAEEDRWLGVLGRVGRGSVAARMIRWRLRGTEQGTHLLRVEMVSNNTEPALVEVPVDVTGLSIAVSFEGDNELVLVIEGNPGASFVIESSSHVFPSPDWQRFSSGVVGDEGARIRLKDVSEGLGQFYRVISP